MKTLTICQPYAALTCLPDEDERAKRVENRKWATNYRGRLAIHAGKSRDWLDEGETPGIDIYGFEIKSLPFGAIVATCKLVDCFQVEHNGERLPAPAKALVHKVRAPECVVRRRPWLATHPHVEGPWCFVLAEVVPLVTPIPWKGQLGFFDVPDSVFEGQEVTYS